MDVNVKKKNFYPLLAFSFILEKDFDIHIFPNGVSESPPIIISEKLSKYDKMFSKKYPYGLNDEGKIKFIDYIDKWKTFIKN